MIKRLWHRIRYNYHMALYESCLDKKMKKQLRQKATYHISMMEMMD